MSFEAAMRPRKSPAFSLIELLAVIAIVGLLASAAVTQFGTTTVRNVAGEGFARKLALDLLQARRRTIATGDNHYVLLSPSAANVASTQLFRRAAGGDVAVDQARQTPSGISASANNSVLEFDFDGAALGAYSIVVSGPTRSWTITTTVATGAIQTTATP